MSGDTPQKPSSASQPLTPKTPAPHPPKDKRLDEAELQMRQISRRSFLWAGVAIVGTLAGRQWLITRRQEYDIPWPFRRALEFNQDLAIDYFAPTRLLPEFPPELAAQPGRALDFDNGDDGQPDDGYDVKSWKIAVVGAYNPADHMPDSSSSDSSASSDSGSTDKKGSGDKKGGADKKGGDKKGSGGTTANTSSDSSDSSSGDSNDSSDNNSGDSSDNSSDSSDDMPGLMLTMADIKKLPRYEMTVEFKCVEGWSRVVHWAGIRMMDFLQKYQPDTLSGDPPDFKNKLDDLVPWISFETPNGGYYVGIDLKSAMHPQTLLAYEMNGKPLTPDHGAPLRLVIPMKYGIKNIKWVGKIEYTRRRPRDFWYEQGYDYYAGH